MRCVCRVLLATSATMVFGCGEAPFAPSTAGGPALAISDGAHNGNAHFFFLPPLVRQAEFSGTFDGSLSPVVRITENGAPLVDLTPTVHLLDELYQVNWHTDDFALDSSKSYRIVVLLDGTELGFADVVVGATGKELRPVNTDEFIALKDGRTLPIKFRIEDGALRGPLTWTLETIDGTSNVLSVWASSPSDVWVAGGFTTLFHFDGSTWTQPGLPSGTLNTNSLFGFSPTSVFAASQAGVMHYDGTMWTFVLGGVGELFGIWGTSATDLFVSGDGRFLHFDGSNWTDIPTGLSTAFNTDRLLAMWGTSSTDVFIAGASVGPKGRILRYDGNTVTEIMTVQGAAVHAIHGTGPNDVFAVGSGGHIWHYDGAAWTGMTSGTSLPLGGVFAVSPVDVYAAGSSGSLLHYDGVTWAPVTSGTSLFLGGIGYGVFALSADLVYVTASPGTLLVGRR